MADATARFDLKVDADASSAGPAASALEKLAAKIREDQKALGELQKAMKNLQGGTNVNIDAFKALQKQIDAKKSSLAASSESFLSLGGNLGKLSSFAKKAGEGAGEATGELEGFLGAAQAASPAAGGLISKVQGLAKSFAALGPAGAVGLAVVAVLVLTGAVLVGLAALARFAFGAADAARSAAILREAATGSAAGAARLDKEITALAGRVPTARAELEKLGNDLARSGLQGNALETAMSAIATASAVMGSAVGSTLQGIVERARMSKRFLLSAFDLQGTGLKIQDVGAAVAKRLGISVQAAIAALQNGQIKLADGIAALDDAVQKKFGAAAARQMLAFPTQLAKAKENLDRLFKDVKIEPLLVALHQVLSLLDENSASGRALKVIFETILNPIFEALGSKGGMLRGFFQGMIIIALTFAIAILKGKKAISEAFGGQGSSDILTVKNAMIAGQIAAVLLGGALAALTIALGLLLLAAVLVALPFIVFGLAIYVASVALGKIGGEIDKVKGKFNSFSLGDAIDSIRNFATDANDAMVEWVSSAATSAGNFILGLVQALTQGKGPVADAVKSLAASALAALAGAAGFDSHSPSRKAHKLALTVPAGLVGGFDAGAADVADAGADLASAGLGGASRGAGQGNAQPISVRSADGKKEFNFYGDWYFDGRRQIRDKSTEDDMTMVLELAFARAGG